MSQRPKKDTGTYYIVLQKIDCDLTEGSLWILNAIVPNKSVIIIKYEGEKAGIWKQAFTSQLKELNHQETHLLLAISDLHERVRLASDNKWLKEGLEIKVGSRVQVLGSPQLQEETKGEVRFKGRRPFENGITFGIELFGEYHGKGDTNGTFRSKKLFKCPENCGVFRTLLGIRLLKEENEIQLNERIVYINDKNEPEFGTVKWKGRLTEYQEEVIYVGVEFDEPIGRGSGKFKGKKLFDSKLNHAALFPALGLMSVSNYEKSIAEAKKIPQLQLPKQQQLLDIDSSVRRRPLDLTPNLPQYTHVLMPQEPHHSPVPIERIQQPAPIERIQPSPIDRIQSSPIDRIQPSPIDRIQPSSIDRILQTSPTERIQQLSPIERIQQPAPIEGIQPTSLANEPQYQEDFHSYHSSNNIEIDLSKVHLEHESGSYRFYDNHEIALNKHRERPIETGDGSSENGISNTSPQQHVGAKPKILVSKQPTYSTSSDSFTSHISSSTQPFPKSQQRTTSDQVSYVTYKENEQKTLKFQVGSYVQLRNGKCGVIRWIGLFPFSKTPNVVIAGLEMDETDYSFTTGTFLGEKVFECEPNRALFVPLEKCFKVQFLDNG